MKTYFSPEIELYDGAQLASLFAYQRFGLLGDSIVSFIGPCDVTAHMVDAEDQRKGEKIQGALMLHFIIEVFNQSLTFGVSLQRIFASLLHDQMAPELHKLGFSIAREGDDLYVQKISEAAAARGKWSISIATCSPVSTLVHFAVNVTNVGTPVATWAIEDELHHSGAGVKSTNTIGASAEAKNKAHALAHVMMEKFSAECTSIVNSARKVHPVGSFQIKKP